MQNKKKKYLKNIVSEVINIFEKANKKRKMEKMAYFLFTQIVFQCLVFLFTV